VRIHYPVVFHIGLLICLSASPLSAVTLEEAMKMASEQHPRLQVAKQNIVAAEGELTEQSAYAYNPELSVEPQRRSTNAGGTSTDYYITLSQGIEMAGKRGIRERSAQAALSTAGHEVEAIRRKLSIDAARAFVELFFSEHTLELRQSQSIGLQQLSLAVARQLEMGESNQLDVNLARSSYASSLNAELAAKQQLSLSRARFYSAIGQMNGDQVGSLKLPMMQVDWELPDDPFDVALASRPELAALRSKLTQSDAQAALTKAQRIPDPSISVMSGREDGEQLIQLGINFSLPVWNSHRGAYKTALAEVARTQAELEWSEYQLRLELQASIHNHTSAMTAVAGAYKAEAQQSAYDNIELARIAFKAGELDLEELVIHSSQGLDAQLTALAIMKQGWLARIRLAEVLGHPEYILEGTIQ